jgi:hypothetical protein
LPPLTLLPALSPPATHIPFPYFTVRTVPNAAPDADVKTADVFVVHDNPPSYEYAIRFTPPPLLASRIAPPPTAIRKFREYVCDHVVPCAPLADLTTTAVVSVPPLGSKPCARPAPARHIAPVPAPDPALVGIPVVNKEIGIFTYATAFVLMVGEKILVLFHDISAVMSVVFIIRDAPAPDVAIQEYPVHAIPFNRPNVVFVSVPVDILHPFEPFGVVV